VLIAFDVLYISARDVTAKPLRERRARLEDLVGHSDRVYAVRCLCSERP
jgi:ATP-dependent DNA ligase